MKKIASLAMAFALGVAFAAAVMAATPKRAPSIVDIDTAVPLVAPSGKASVVPLGDGLNAWMGVLRMDANGAVPRHQDASEEFIYVLKGTGTISIEGRKHQLKPGSAVYMPAGATVSYHNGASELVALQVFAGTESAAKYKTWKQASK